jgi:predicted sulfurtransferase
VCSSDLEQCTGCKRSVCRSHLLICPRCGKRVCEQCLRKKTTVRSALRGKLRETRCVLCLGLPDAHISI